MHAEVFRCEAPQSLQVTLKWLREEKEKYIHVGKNI